MSVPVLRTSWKPTSPYPRASFLPQRYARSSRSFCKARHCRKKTKPGERCPLDTRSQAATVATRSLPAAALASGEESSRQLVFAPSASTLSPNSSPAKCCDISQVLAHQVSARQTSALPNTELRCVSSSYRFLPILRLRMFCNYRGRIYCYRRWPGRFHSSRTWRRSLFRCHQLHFFLNMPGVGEYPHIRYAQESLAYDLCNFQRIVCFPWQSSHDAHHRFADGRLPFDSHCRCAALARQIKESPLRIFNFSPHRKPIQIAHRFPTAREVFCFQWHLRGQYRTLLDENRSDFQYSIHLKLSMAKLDRRVRRQLHVQSTNKTNFYSNGPWAGSNRVQKPMAPAVPHFRAIKWPGRKLSAAR